VLSGATPLHWIIPCAVRALNACIVPSGIVTHLGTNIWLKALVDICGQKMQLSLRNSTHFSMSIEVFGRKEECL